MNEQKPITITVDAPTPIRTIHIEFADEAMEDYGLSDFEEFPKAPRTIQKPPPAEGVELF